jgi:hypothetical protein
MILLIPEAHAIAEVPLSASKGQCLDALEMTASVLGIVARDRDLGITPLPSPISRMTLRTLPLVESGR